MMKARKDKKNDVGGGEEPLELESTARNDKLKDLMRQRMERKSAAKEEVVKHVADTEAADAPTIDASVAIEKTEKELKKDALMEKLRVRKAEQGEGASLAPEQKKERRRSTGAADGLAEKLKLMKQDLAEKQERRHSVGGGAAADAVTDLVAQLREKREKKQTEEGEPSEEAVEARRSRASSIVREKLQKRQKAKEENGALKILKEEPNLEGKDVTIDEDVIVAKEDEKMEEGIVDLKKENEDGEIENNGSLMDQVKRKLENLAVAQSITAYTLGGIVEAKWEDDGKWYTAKIDAVISDGEMYDLTFVEYGNSQRTNADNIRPSMSKPIVPSLTLTDDSLADSHKSGRRTPRSPRGSQATHSAPSSPLQSRARKAMEAAKKMQAARKSQASSSTTSPRDTDDAVSGKRRQSRARTSTLSAEPPIIVLTASSLPTDDLEALQEKELRQEETEARRAREEEEARQKVACRTKAKQEEQEKRKQLENEKTRELEQREKDNSYRQQKEHELALAAETERRAQAEKGKQEQERAQEKRAREEADARAKAEAYRRAEMQRRAKEAEMQKRAQAEAHKRQQEAKRRATQNQKSQTNADGNVNDQGGFFAFIGGIIHIFDSDSDSE